MIKIVDAKYEKVDIETTVRNNYNHLSSKEKTMLLKVLTDFDPLFDGTLGNWKMKPVSLQVKADVTIYHGIAYPVPKGHLQVLKKELKHLCDLGVLEWQPLSEWALPSLSFQRKIGQCDCYLISGK